VTGEDKRTFCALPKDTHTLIVLGNSKKFHLVFELLLDNNAFITSLSISHSI